MTSKEVKTLVNNISKLLRFGEESSGFDGFFFSEDVSHILSKESVSLVMSDHPEWSQLQAYEHFLIPIIIANPDKHWTISSIYRTLATSCSEEAIKRRYFERWFEHLMLAKLSGIKDVEGVSNFYAMLLTRDSCCNLCKPLGNDKIYNFDELLSTLPSIVNKCLHEESCHAGISVMTENRYNLMMRRRK